MIQMKGFSVARAKPITFIESNGQMLAQVDEVRLEEAYAVGLQVAKKHTCMIAKEDGLPIPKGSGTFVQVNGQLFIATAAHLFGVFRPDEPVGIYWGEDDNRTEVLRKSVIVNDRLDLAAIPLPAGTAACSVSLKGSQAEQEGPESGLLVVSGIPSQNCRTDRESRTVFVGHYSVACVKLPPERWPTNPDEPISCDDDLFLNYTRLATDSRGEPMCQVDPHGMSGGGVWSVPEVPHGIWSPANARLVAVQLSVEDSQWRYLRAKRIGCWMRLLTG